MTALGFALVFTAATAFAAHSAREDWQAGVIHSALTNAMLATACFAAAALALASYL